MFSKLQNIPVVTKAMDTDLNRIDIENRKKHLFCTLVDIESTTM